MNVLKSSTKYWQTVSTLEQHVFELRGSTYKRIFSINTVNVFSLSYDYLNILISLTYFIVRIQYIIHIT